MVGVATLSSAILSDTGLEGDGEGSRLDVIPTRPENSRLDDRESRVVDFLTLEHGYRKVSDPSSVSESAFALKISHILTKEQSSDVTHYL